MTLPVRWLPKLQGPPTLLQAMRRSGRWLAAFGAVAALVSGADAATPSVAKIAFVRFTAQTGRPHVYVISPGGGNAKLLKLRVATATGSPAWSRDGRRLAFVAGVNASGEPAISSGDELYIARADGLGVRQLTHDRSHESGASWSPSGNRLVFVRTAPKGSGSALWIIGSDGHRQRRLTFGSTDLEPSWAPNGRSIVFLRIDPKTYQSGIWLIRPDGSGPRRILANHQGVAEPVWSPDGRRLLVEDGHAIYIVRPNGSGRRKIVNLSADAKGALEDPQPAWSPDGRWIVFCQLRAGALGISDIWLVGTDGKGLRRVTRSPELDTDPSWGS